MTITSQNLTCFLVYLATQTNYTNKYIQNSETQRWALVVKLFWSPCLFLFFWSFSSSVKIIIHCFPKTIFTIKCLCGLNKSNLFKIKNQWASKQQFLFMLKCFLCSCRGGTLLNLCNNNQICGQNLLKKETISCFEVLRLESYQIHSSECFVLCNFRVTTSTACLSLGVWDWHDLTCKPSLQNGWRFLDVGVVWQNLGWLGWLSLWKKLKDDVMIIVKLLLTCKYNFLTSNLEWASPFCLDVLILMHIVN